MPDRTTSRAPRAAPRKPPLDVVLVNPRGFCAGVRRAITAVEAALDRYGAPVYVRRPIVHNLAVVRALEARGAVFVQELEEMPEGAVAILSAHGVPRTVHEEAERRGLRWYDAVCPLVRKVHREVARHHEAGRQIVLVGHAGHPEIVGTLDQAPAGAVALVGSPADVAGLALDPSRPTAYAVQTTYSQDEARDVVDALEARFPDLAAPPTSDICYATSNRQAAVKSVAPEVDAFLVAGEGFSSNAARLAEVARAAGCPAVQLVANAEAVDWPALAEPRRLGLTAAASTPDTIVAELLDALASRFSVTTKEAEGPEERTIFRPLELA